MPLLLRLQAYFPDQIAVFPVIVLDGPGVKQSLLDKARFFKARQIAESALSGVDS